MKNDDIKTVELQRNYVYPFEYNFELFKEDPCKIRIDVLRGIIEHSTTEKVDFKNATLLLLDYIETLTER